MPRTVIGVVFSAEPDVALKTQATATRHAVNRSPERVRWRVFFDMRPHEASRDDEWGALIRHARQCRPQVQLHDDGDATRMKTLPSLERSSAHRRAGAA